LGVFKYYLATSIFTPFFMATSLSVLQVFTDDTGSGVAYKNRWLKRQIINYIDSSSSSTITDLSNMLGSSIPKTTSLVNELMEDGLLEEHGKIDSTGGRRASVFGLVASSGYFLGIDVHRYHINIGIIDFRKTLVKVEEKLPYQLANTSDAYLQLVEVVTKFINSLSIEPNLIIAACFNLSGRINTASGYSYSYFHFQEAPLSDSLSRDIGILSYVENDSRAMAFGEFFGGKPFEVKNALFLNMDYGLGLGILTDGKMYYGKSGFSGEIGHVPMFQNEILCHCGKKGCLETEVSGWALLRSFKEKIEQGVSSQVMNLCPDLEAVKLENIVEGALNDDVLCIELISELGEKLGRALSFLINVFNPEWVILGGTLSKTGDYIRLPMRSAINKYSLGLVNNDTQLRLSKIGETAGIIGGALLARHKLMQTA
jgi:predicted NBD/HSP70 family sugar kinase